MWSALRPWKGPHLLLHEVRYWYVGRGLDASIADDGSVTFHDKDGVVAAPLPLMNRFGFGGRANHESINGASPAPSGRMGSSKVSPGIGISDPARLLSRRASSKDPHALERADFLGRTRELRDWLHVRAHERSAEHATEGMKRELARIWFEASLSPTQRQEQTFAIWDACDEAETRARDAVVHYMRELERTRGVCPFDAATLAHLQASRRSRELFVPCDAATTDRRP